MSRGLTKTKCPFHANAKRIDIYQKLLQEDYYEANANGVETESKEQLIAWYDTLSNTELLDILYTDEHYGICWCEEK